MANLIDLRGRGPTRRQLLGLGGIAIALVVAVAVPLVLYAQGRFDKRIEVTLTSDTVGDGLVSGADVKYRGLLVGKVDAVTTTRNGGQVLTLSIDAKQADEMSGGLAASFAPSNIFGVVGVELEPTATGVVLHDGAVIPMGDTAEQVSAIGVLRDVGRVTNTLTGKQFDELVNRFDQIAAELHPLLRSGFDLLNLAAAHQKMPLALVLQIAANDIDGAGQLADPFVGLFTTLVEKTELYADPVQTEAVTGSLTGLVQLFIELGKVVGASQKELATSLDAAMTLGAPLGYTLGTVAPATEDVHTLIDRIERSMPAQNGKTTLQLGVTLQSLPQITSVLGGGR